MMRDVDGDVAPQPLKQAGEANVEGGHELPPLQVPLRGAPPLVRRGGPRGGPPAGLGGRGRLQQLGLPGVTPWRTITLGKSLKPIVETTIPWDVVEPLYEPSQDYEYGKKLNF